MSPLYRAFRCVCVYVFKIIIILIQKIKKERKKHQRLTVLFLHHNTNKQQVSHSSRSYLLLPCSAPRSAALLLPSDLRGFSFFFRPSTSSYSSTTGAFFFLSEVGACESSRTSLPPCQAFSPSSIRLEGKPPQHHHQPGCSVLCVRSVNAPADHPAESGEGWRRGREWMGGRRRRGVAFSFILCKRSK